MPADRRQSQHGDLQLFYNRKRKQKNSFFDYTHAYFKRQMEKQWKIIVVIIDSIQQKDLISSALCRMPHQHTVNRCASTLTAQ